MSDPLPPSLYISLPDGEKRAVVPAAVETYNGVRFFIHAHHNNEIMVRATEFRSGMALPFTTSVEVKTTRSLARACIDLHGAPKINALAAQHPALNE